MEAFSFDGQAVPIHPGDTLASALHRAGIRVLSRSLKYHRPRGYACGVGSCAGCFVNVDGEPNVPACTQRAQAGATVESQNRLGSAKRDLLGVVDKVYPKGFDPHGAFTKPVLLNKAFLHAVRFMSGVGKVPGPEATAPAAKYAEHTTDVLIVGGGAHGLAAARAALDAGKSVTLVDEMERLGGGALWDPDEQATRAAAHEISSSSATIWTRTLAFGIYDGQVAVARPSATGHDLVLVKATNIHLTPGRHDAVPLFPNNDIPGVMTLRAARRLLHGHDVLPGSLVAFHGTPPQTFLEALKAKGATLVAAGAVEEVRGGTRAERVRIDGQWHTCDAVVCDIATTPRIELAQQAGCALEWQNGVLQPAGEGPQTSIAHVQAHYTEAR